MHFRLSDDQQMIVSTFRRYADVELRKVAADADREGKAPAGLLAAAREQLGLGLDAVPAEAGGLLEGSYGHLDRALRGIELGKGCPGLAALLEASVEPALAVGRWGSSPARDALFSALTSGGHAATAHDGARRLQVTAQGDGVVLAGELPAVPALAGASHLLVCAYLDGAPVIVLADTRRFEVAPHVPSPWRAAGWAAARFPTVAVEPAFVVARGDAAARELLAWWRASLAARACGAGEAALAHAAQYASERVQFGRPIGRFESLARLADWAETLVLGAKLIALRGAGLLDEGADPDAAFDTVSRARDLAGNALSRATIDAVQIYGGYGFVNDFPVEKLMRDARAFEAVSGDEAFERVLRKVAA